MKTKRRFKSSNLSRLLLVFSVYFIFILPFLSPLIETLSNQNIRAANVYYDFVAEASKAIWKSGAGTLSFPGSPSDTKGFALWRTNSVLEDEITYQKVLETHPEWKDKVGYISGTYPEITIPENAKLELKFGFLKGATNTDGVRFRVLMDLGTGDILLYEKVKGYTKSLESATIDLSKYQGKKAKFTLYVSVYATSTQDWACWVDAKLTYLGMPDLIVSDIWVDNNRFVHYKIKNIGNAPTSYQTTTFTVVLYINNSVKAIDGVSNIIQPNEEYENYFKNFLYPYPSTQEYLKVCVDAGNSIKESVETNNCLEKIEKPQFGGIKVDTGCPNVKVEIYDEKNNLLNSGISDLKNYYNTGFVLLPGTYKVTVSKEGCSFEPPYLVVKITANQLVGVSFNCLCKKGPDLIVTEIDYQTVKGKIRYKIKNIGDDRITSPFVNSLSIDGNFVCEDTCNQQIAPGQEILMEFPCNYIPTPSSDVIRVCADFKNQVKESNEDNNCLQIKRLFPDLAVKSIDCEYLSKTVRFSIINYGDEKVWDPFEILLYINGVLKDRIEVKNNIAPNEIFESSFINCITSCENLKIKIVVDPKGVIDEVYKENNSMEKECFCSEDLPDLIVMNLFYENKKICYTIRNIGKKEINLGSIFNSLYIDGNKVIDDEIKLNAILGANREISNCLEYRIKPGKHNIKICADSKNNIKESDEKNNCYEKNLSIEENLPDLVVYNIVCTGDNLISFTIKNNGRDFTKLSWSGVAYIYFDDVMKKTIDLRAPTSIEMGGIEKANGKNTYQTDLQISTYTKVKVVVDPLNEIEEINEENNSKEQRIQPCRTKLPDLIISQVWRKNDKLYYKIKNVGEGEVANANICSVLYIDGKQIKEDCFKSRLAPSEEIERYFDYQWSITPPEDVVKVCVDWQNKIQESNETNNCLEKAFPAPQILPQEACGCFESDKFNARVTPYDGFAVGNVLGGPEDEIVTAVDEDARGDDGKFYIYNYKGDVLKTFEARFTHHDRIAIGNLWADNNYEEIAVAIDEDDKIYIYDASGTLLRTFPVRFTPYDTFAIGNVYGDEKDEIIIAIDEDDKVYVYSNTGEKLFEFALPWNFDGSYDLGVKEGHNDAMAVGNVFGDDYDEILFVDQHGNDSILYIYSVSSGKLILKNTLPVRFTPCDSLSTGDVLGNDREEILIAIDEDHMIYIYDAVFGLIKCRYAEITPVDLIAAGKVSGGKKDEIIVAQDDNRKIFIIKEEP